MFFDELNDFANRLEVFNFRIRNFYVESIFDGHDKINKSKGICVQILNQFGILGYLGGIYAELLSNNIDNFLQNHLIFLLSCSICQVLHRLPYGQNAAGMIQSGCTSHTLYGCTAYLSIAIPHSVLNFSVFKGEP